MEYIGKKCFYGSEIQKILFSVSVRKIEAEAFCDCRQLKKITFVEGSMLQAIGNNCFKQSGLEEFYAPQYLKYIGAESFSDCTNLKRVELNEGLKMLMGG